MMKKDGLGGRGQAVRLSVAWSTEMFAQIDRQIRYIKLVARNDKGNTLTDEPRPVVHTDGHGGESYRSICGIPDDVDMLGDIGRGASVFALGDDDAIAT